MGEFHIISGRQSAGFMAVTGIFLAIVAMVIGFREYVFSLLFGTMGGVWYYLLLDYQYQKGLRTSPFQAAMNVNNGMLSRVCVVIAFVLVGIRFFDAHIPSVLIGVFIPLRLLIVYQVIRIATEPDDDIAKERGGKRGNRHHSGMFHDSGRNYDS